MTNSIKNTVQDEDYTQGYGSLYKFITPMNLGLESLLFYLKYETIDTVILLQKTSRSFQKDGAVTRKASLWYIFQSWLLWVQVW